ncbi:MAG: S8 family serine peptidase [Oscillospiraceae bacterium]|jgi:hypothetical protein|nr:S8 family serine peptidase [Oscillospiraceae bacterium]
MKKLSFVLALVLIFSLFTPAIAESAPDGAYIVKLSGSTTGVSRAAASVAAEEIYSDAGLYRVESYEDVKKLGESVEYYEPDSVSTLTGVTNDYFSDYQWQLEYMDVPEVWADGYNGSGVRVGIIDSGLNTGHEDLRGISIARGYNTIYNNYDVVDQTGHGTFISGLLGAAVNNRLGIAGLCSGITLVPIKCFEGDTTSTSYIIEGVYEAIDRYDCDVINLSNATDDNIWSFQEAVRYAESKGVLVVAAAGNDGQYDNSLQYPAAYDEVIGVGSVDEWGYVSDFSRRNNSVFVTAPGEDITSLWHNYSDEYFLRGQGTSYAAPMVAAAGAYLKQKDSSADTDLFKSLLQDSVIDAGSRGWDKSYGYGILNMSTFIDAMDEYYTNVGTIFQDVKNHWAKDAIGFCYDNGWMNGVSSNTFDPDGVTNRAQFVTILSRVSGDRISGYTNYFTDVPAGSYYEQPAAWGAATKLVNGTSSTTFGPMNIVTREQMATFLYRFALAYGITDEYHDYRSLQPYNDFNKISDYAYEAMAWAVNLGLINGVTSTTLSPGGNATRAQVATIITRFAELY